MYGVGMAIKATVAREAEQDAARVIVLHLLEGTNTLDDVKGADIPDLMRAIAVGIARERDRVAAAADEPALPPLKFEVEGMVSAYGSPGLDGRTGLGGDDYVEFAAADAQCSTVCVRVASARLLAAVRERWTRESADRRYRITIAEIV